MIHAWIAENHAETAHAVDPRLFPKSHTDAWADFLADNAIHGKFRITRFDKSMGLVERKRKHPTPDVVLRLGEEFCFELDNDAEGYAVAFQIFNGTVHPLPIGANDELSIPLTHGTHLLPLNEAGRPDPLVEESDFGLHEFVIAVARTTALLPTPTAPPKPNDSVEVHSLRIRVTISD